MTDFDLDTSGVDEALAQLEEAEEDWSDETEWAVGTAVNYAVFVEYGTSKMRAQPYLRPAVRQVMRQDADEIADSADSIDELIRKLAFQIERRAKQKAPVDTGTLQNSIRAVPAGDIDSLPTAEEIDPDNNE